MPHLHQTKELARLVAKPHLTLYRWQGQNKGGPLTVAYAGLGYAAPTLKSLLFTSSSVETKVAQVPILQPEKLLDISDSDIIIVESSKHLIKKLPSEGSITLPFRLRFVLDLSGTLEDVENRFRRDARRNEVRKTERFGYEYEVSHSKADLEMFYHKMYVPTIQKRHGKLATIISEREAYQILRHGLLFLVKRDNDYAAGGLCFIEQGLLRFQEMGVLNGDEQLMKEGAVGAMNYLRICWAHKVNCLGVNFGECWPYMSGIYQSKRKWGAKVGLPPHENKQIWLNVRRNTPAVAQFLEQNPWIVTDSQGDLFGLIVTTDPENISQKERDKWDKSYETPGLKGLLVQPVSQLGNY
jgi:hypothetical protein